MKIPWPIPDYPDEVDDEWVYHIYPKFGGCWCATHTKLLQSHVIKLFKWENAPLFKDEIEIAEILKEVKHNNLVQVLDVVRSKEMPGIYYIMEYCEGGDLNGLIQNHAMVGKQAQLDWIIKVASDILQGLVELHRRNYKHRDIKPKNILLKNGVYKIGDYGLVKLQRLVTKLVTELPAKGTPSYMPPETDETLGLPPPDHRWDIYSVGITLREMVTGVSPPSQYEETSPHPPNGIPQSFWEIVIKATQYHPDSRYPSAEELLQEVNKIELTD